MMTGIVSVSSLYLIYRILTLVFLHLFGVYDFRHHLIKNTALVFLIPVVSFWYPAKAYPGYRTFPATSYF